jgi:hypothetical protein
MASVAYVSGGRRKVHKEAAMARIHAAQVPDP